MFDLKDLVRTAQLVIGPIETEILQLASDKVEEPDDTTVAMVRLAKKDVEEFTFETMKHKLESERVGLYEYEFDKLKNSLLCEMDEAINAAYL